MSVKGYKAFDRNMKCPGFQYEVGKTYTLENPEDLKLCGTGFHFCRYPVHLPTYYDLDVSRFAEIEAVGTVIDSNSQHKSVTDSIKIVREISYNEMINLCNVGKYNSAIQNIGDNNTGDRNLGDRNTGFVNIGVCNACYFNYGSSNTGDNNNGFCNLGSFNRINGGFGCFLTDESQQKMYFFNKPSDWTFADWCMSRARKILISYGLGSKKYIRWKSYIYMTEKEKEANPHWKKIGGCLTKTDSYCPTSQEWWNELCEDDKNEIMSLPNFDADIFYECTGIKINKEV